MSVTIKSKVLPIGPSNKHGGEKEEEIDSTEIEWRYKYGYGEGLKAYVSSPSIDKLSIVVPVNDEERRKHIILTLIEAAKDESPQPSKFASDSDLVTGFSVKNAPWRGKYKVAVNFTMDGIPEPILVQAGPTSNFTNSFVRLELNPRALGPKGLSRFKVALGQTTTGAFEWDQVIKSGKVTRYDVAVDMYNVDTRQIVWASEIKGKTHLYTDPDGGTQTVYIGTKSNSSQYYYDKLAETKDHDKPVEFVGYHTRVEFRVTTGKMLVDLKNVDNPLHKLSLYHLDEPPPGVERWIWNLVRVNCVHKGVQNALLDLPEGLRPLVACKLEECLKRIWRPDQLWNAWPSVVNKSGLLAPSPSLFLSEAEDEGTVPDHP